MAAPDNLLTRIRGEYEEMPGLQLTLAQACRLWQVDTTTGECLLETLIRQNFLVRSRDGAFIAGPRWRERPAPQEAALRPGATVAPHAFDGPPEFTDAIVTREGPRGIDGHRASVGSCTIAIPPPVDEILQSPAVPSSRLPVRISPISTSCCIGMLATDQDGTEAYTGLWASVRNDG